MTQLFQGSLNRPKLIKVLKKSIKKVVSQNGINSSTRHGNKQLDLLLTTILQHPFTSTKQLETVGTIIGSRIVELSQQKGKKNLDQGIIQELSSEEFLSPELLKSPAVVPQVQQQKPSTPISDVIEKPPTTQNQVIDSKPTTVEEPEPEALKEPSEEPSTPVTEPIEETEPEALQEPAEEPATPVTEPIEDIEPEALQEALEIEEPEPEALLEEPLEIEEPEPEALEEPEEDNTSAEIAKKDKQVSVGLKKRIEEDIKTAMKAKDKIRLETVRSIKKAILEKEVALRPSGQDILTPEQEIELLAQQAKQRRESIEQYQKGGRDNLAEKEAMELAIIETYLPAQLSEEQLGEILDGIIAEIGATTAKDMGRVMGVAMKQLKGQADGKQIQTMVKEKLTQ